MRADLVMPERLDATTGLDLLIRWVLLSPRLERAIGKLTRKIALRIVHLTRHKAKGSST